MPPVKTLRFSYFFGRAKLLHHLFRHCTVVVASGVASGVAQRPRETPPPLLWLVVFGIMRIGRCKRGGVIQSSTHAVTAVRRTHRRR